MALRQTQLLFNIALQPISFLYFYHLTDVNKLRYQASESKMASETTCTGRTFNPTSAISFLRDLRQKFCWRWIPQIFNFSGIKENATFIQKRDTKWEIRDPCSLYDARNLPAASSFSDVPGGSLAISANLLCLYGRAIWLLYEICVICSGSKTKRVWT